MNRSTPPPITSIYAPTFVEHKPGDPDFDIGEQPPLVTEEGTFYPAVEFSVSHMGRNDGARHAVLALTIIKGDGGMYTPLTSAGARSVAAALIRIAEQIEAGAATQASAQLAKLRKGGN